MVSFVLFYLQSSFSINFTNNLIEKYPTSAAAAIINTEIVFLDGDDHSRPLKNGGVKIRGDQLQYPVGETQQGKIFRMKDITPKHCY